MSWMQWTESVRGPSTGALGAGTNQATSRTESMKGDGGTRESLMVLTEQQYATVGKVKHKMEDGLSTSDG